MDAVTRIEQALQTAIGRADVPGCPPRLAAAMRHAVFPRGARIRPRLCLAVAAACGDDEPALADAAAASIELLHCASLVHDDLPCFDDAATRRGRPSVHRAFGEPLAVLAGDALIVLAFQTLGRFSHAPQRLALLVMTVSRSVGMPFGIVAGQAWECEPHVDLGPLSPRQDRRAVRRGHDCGRGGGRGGLRALAHCSEKSWARLTRSPTTFAMRPPTPTRSESRPAGMQHSGVQTR